jgi:hypothetical protein
MLLKKIRSTEPLCHLGGEQTLIWHEPGRDLDADRHAFEYLIETDYSITPLQPLPFSLDIMDSKKARTLAVSQLSHKILPSPFPQSSSLAKHASASSTLSCTSFQVVNTQSL